MNPSSPDISAPPSPGSRALFLAAALIVLAALAAYANSLSGPFIFDDQTAIVDNPTIRHLWPPTESLTPPLNQTTSGRPLLNGSFALNYALGGLDPFGYHVLNLLIHLLAGLTFFGLVRRTLLHPSLRERWAGAALPIALASALIWTVHPLQTEAVTYVVQRGESLMGLFYLLTLYTFARSAGSPQPARWQIFSVLACLLGMATKEVMATAPLMVFLYDRTFVAGSFRDAWRRRRAYYSALAATGLLLAALMTTTHGRGGTAGFGLPFAWWQYALTQLRVVTHYLSLAVWPSPLVLDYGNTMVEENPYAALPCALWVLGLVALALWALRYRPVTGFLGAWFFLILAPSSSILPVVTQATAEHRLYLPLAAVVVFAVCGLYAWLGPRSWWAWLALVPVLAWLTARRNDDYHSVLSIWQDNVANCPGNARAYNNLGDYWLAAGNPKTALDDYLDCHGETVANRQPWVNAGSENCLQPWNQWRARGPAIDPRPCFDIE